MTLTSTDPLPRRLSRDELPEDTVALARFLLGKELVHRIGGLLLAGRIVETEAYLPDDPSCHAFNGPTRRNRSLFLPHGHAYVYLSYGCWPLFNVSGGKAGMGAGVLVRALEPTAGLAAMRESLPAAKDRDLTRGPGRLARALRISLDHDGVDLCSEGPLWLGPGAPPHEIGASIRIGITKAADLPLRFFERGSPYLSGSRSLNGAPGHRPAAARQARARDG